MRSRETKTLKFHVPTGDLNSSMGSPLKKIAKTQAHAAAQHSPCKSAEQRALSLRPQEKPNHHLGHTYLRISFFTSRSSSSWSF